MILKTEFFKLIDEWKDENDILKQISEDKDYDKKFDYTYVFLHDEGCWCEVFKLIKPDKIVNIDGIEFLESSLNSCNWEDYKDCQEGMVEDVDGNLHNVGLSYDNITNYYLI